MYFKRFFFIGMIAVIASCGSTKNETDLNSSDLEYIESLGVLNTGETIELFESNGGFEGIHQSGNFITAERMASYWIEDDEKTIESAFYSEIDSMVLTDLVTKLTYASYITVYRSNGSNFKVYVDADSTRTYEFYERALSHLEKAH